MGPISTMSTQSARTALQHTEPWEPGLDLSHPLGTATAELSQCLCGISPSHMRTLFQVLFALLCFHPRTREDPKVWLYPRLRSAALHRLRISSWLMTSCFPTVVRWRGVIRKWLKDSIVFLAQGFFSFLFGVTAPWVFSALWGQNQSHYFNLKKSHEWVATYRRGWCVS